MDYQSFTDLGICVDYGGGENQNADYGYVWLHLCLQAWSVAQVECRPCLMHSAFEIAYEACETKKKWVVVCLFCTAADIASED